MSSWRGDKAAEKQHPGTATPTTAERDPTPGNGAAERWGLLRNGGGRGRAHEYGPGGKDTERAAMLQARG